MHSWKHSKYQVNDWQTDYQPRLFATFQAIRPAKSMKTQGSGQSGEPFLRRGRARPVRLSHLRLAAYVRARGSPKGDGDTLSAHLCPGNPPRTGLGPFRKPCPPIPKRRRYSEKYHPLLPNLIRAFLELDFHPVPAGQQALYVSIFDIRACLINPSEVFRSATAQALRSDDDGLAALFRRGVTPQTGSYRPKDELRHL